MIWDNKEKLYRIAASIVFFLLNKGEVFGREPLPKIPCRSKIQELRLPQVLNYMGAELKEVAPRVFALQCRSHARLCHLFMRPQEHYEGPHFRGKAFSLTEYKKWYRKNIGRENKFTYLTDWAGFNIPSSILVPFENGKFESLSKHELLMLQLKKIIGNDFYLIGFKGSEIDTFKHELAHGLWSTNKKYRQRITEALSSENLAGIKTQLIKTGGYHKDVLDDEVQAYLISGLESLYSEPYQPQALKKYAKLQRALRDIFKEFKNF